MKDNIKYVLLILLVAIIAFLIINPIIKKGKINKTDDVEVQSGESIKLELEVGTVSGEYINEHTDKLEIRINSFDEMVSTSLRADLKPVLFDEYPKVLRFLAAVEFPKNFNLSSYYAIYTRKDLDTNEYDLLHDYVASFENMIDGKILDENGEVISDKNKNILISMSYKEPPIRDYYAMDSSGFSKSKIGYLDVEIQKYYDIYIAQFKIDNAYFDIETLGISQDELVRLIISINNSFVKFGQKVEK